MGSWHGSKPFWNALWLYIIEIPVNFMENPWEMMVYGNNLIWLVVWNMIGLCFPYIGNFIIPTDELLFFRGVETTNQVYYWIIDWLWLLLFSMICYFRHILIITMHIYAYFYDSYCHYGCYLLCINDYTFIPYLGDDANPFASNLSVNGGILFP